MNISFGDLFAEYEYNYSANYADGTTPNSVGTRAAEDFENLSCLTKKNMFLVFLVLKVECKLKFDTHVEIISKKAHRKLNVLSRIRSFLKEVFL